MGMFCMRSKMGWNFEMSVKCLQFVVALVQVYSCGCLSLDYSIPAVQKCDFNRLPDKAGDLVVPAHRMSIKEEFTFRLSERCATRLPHCMKSTCSTPMAQFPVSFAEDAVQSMNSSSDYYQVEETVVLFTPKAYLRVGNEYFSTDDYCVYSQTGDTLVLKICPSKCGGEYSVSGRIEEGRSLVSDPFEVCVPKCCSLHKVLDLESESCVYTKTGVPWAPLVYRSASRQICGEKRANLKLHYIQTAPDCERFVKYFLKSVPGSTRVRFRLLTNGSVLLREIGASTWSRLENGYFCMDGIKLGSAYRGDQVLLLCEEALVGGEFEEEEERGNGSAASFGDESEKRLTASGIAYTVLLFSGIPFLLITELVYVLVWGQQNVHGWTIAGHTLAVLLHYLAQGVANTVSRILTSEQNASSVCMLTGVLNHFFVLASFFWLTVINYDLFSMFRHMKTTVGRSRGLKRFLVYSCIAWGIPFCVVAVSLVLDMLYGLYGDDGDCEIDFVVPLALYGHKSCYMVKDARPYYLYYPVGVLMVVNLVLAVLTSVLIGRHNREGAGAHGEFKRNVKHRRKFLVMAKLFVVMGLVWILEVFVWSFIKENEVLPWYLVFPDVFNFFQAVAIFLLFACQPKILGQVAEKYPRLRGFTGLLMRLSSCGKNKGVVDVKGVSSGG